MSDVPGSGRASSRRRLLRGLGAALLALAVWLGAAAFLLLRDPGGAPPGLAGPGNDGLWTAHRWFDDSDREPVGDAELAEMVARCRQLGIRHLFVHAGPVDARGEIPRFAPERWARVRDAFGPDFRRYAYLGAINRQYWGVADDTLDLGDPAARARIAEVCRTLVADAGFDGIHYDIEPIQDGDAGFLALLEATRAALPPGAPISVATPHFRPPLMPPVDPFTRFWTADYYRKVAFRCDQVAYMGYDSMMPTSGLYERFMRYQLRSMGPLIACELLVGVPTYDEPTASHMAGVETVESGLRGARLGGFGQGVAIYADWTTSAREWTEFRAARD